MKFLLAIVAWFFSAGSFAHNGNDGWVTIQNYELWSSTYKDPQVRVMIKNDSYYNPAIKACGESDSYMVSTQLSSQQQDRIFTILLTASVSGKPVKIRLDTDSCELNRPSIITAII